MIDEDPAHQLSGDSEEVGPILPLRLSLIHKLEVELIDECRCLQSMSGAFASHVIAGQPSQLGFDIGKQTIEGRSIVEVRTNRQGLRETPGRVSRAWAHWTRGYKQDPAAILKTFADGGESYDELIVVRQIPVYSHCEHHLAPFFGHATVGYLPSGHIVGLSKLTRLVNCFAARLQVQERLTQQIAQSLIEHLQPKAVGVIIRCRHMCMESRGIAVAGEETVTSAMLGDLKTNAAQRAEFLALAEQPQ